jgi:CheY-like chemotaxis protein
MVSGPAGGQRTAAARRLLLVDDDTDLREALADILADEGFEVVQAEDGAAALDLLRSGVAADLILLDLMMPVMDGYDFLSVYDGDRSRPLVPIFIVTAGSEPDVARLGARPVFRKPIDLPRLLAALRG